MQGTATEGPSGSILFKFENGTEAHVEWTPFGELGDGDGGEFTEDGIEDNTTGYGLDYLVALAYANVSNQGGPIKPAKGAGKQPISTPQKPGARERAIALWRLATILRTNTDAELHVIGEACDREARIRAMSIGIEYSDVEPEVNGEYDHDISAIMD